VLPEDLGQLKNPMAASEIEPATFLLPEGVKVGAVCEVMTIHSLSSSHWALQPSH
jgi:hypothetical protein